MFCSHPPKPFILRQIAKQTGCPTGFGSRRVQPKAVDFTSLFLIVESPKEVEAWTQANASGPEDFLY